MRRGRREARSQVSKRLGELGDHFMRRLARLGLAQPGCCRSADGGAN